MPKLHKHVKLTFALVFISTFIACGSPKIAMTTQTWQSQKLSFQTPEEYHTVDYDNVLIVTQREDNLPAPGESMMELMIITTETSAEEAAQVLNFYPNFSAEDVEIGNYNVKKVQYGIDGSDVVYTMYIVENNEGKGIEFVPGLGHEEFAKETIETLSFE